MKISWPMKITEAQLRPWSWIVLATLFAVLFLGALVYDRTDWPKPTLLMGESTYLMQAESLGRDFDLAYSRGDFLRFQLRHHGEPPDLELASGSRGRAIAYDQPFPYALWLAPFVRLAPESGFVFANLLLLGLAAFAAVRALAPVLGAAAPLWVAIFLFASVAWRYVWLVSGELFLFTVLVVAFSWIVRSHETDRSTPWLAVGALLAIPLATRPLYGVFVVAAFFALPKSGAGPRRSTLLAGTFAGLLIQMAAQWWWSGGLHFFGTSRFRFTRETGFPLIDFAAADWAGSVKRFQALYWDGAPRFSWGLDPLLWLWDVVYLFAGRHIGLLPYFLPLVIVIAFGSYKGYRRALAIAAGAWIVLLIAVHPFNLHGGEGTIGNRLFLPVYGVLWFLLARRPGWIQAGLTVALAAPFLWTSWSSPWSYPISGAGGYRYVSPVADAILPFETSQRWIPVNQTADHMGMRLRLVNDDVWAETRKERLMLDAGRRARIVVASPRRLPSLVLEFPSQDAPSRLRVQGARLEESVLLAEGGISFRLRPRGLGLRRHATWWTPDRQWFYVLDLELPKPEEGEASRPLAFQMMSDVLFEP